MSARSRSSLSTAVALALALGSGSGCASDEPAKSTPPARRPAPPAADAPASVEPRPIVLKGSKTADAPAATSTTPEEQERIARLKASAEASQGRHEGGEPAKFQAVSASPRGPVKGSSAWLDSLAAARERARSERKLVLLDFTGSDWCGWCMKLKSEVFDTPQFQEWASNNAVLLEVDFPRKKPQSDQLKAQNQELESQLKVKGYPTIVFQDESGKVFGTLGYMEGGPDVWLKSAQAIVDKFNKL